MQQELAFHKRREGKGKAGPPQVCFRFGVFLLFASNETCLRTVGLWSFSRFETVYPCPLARGVTNGPTLKVITKGRVRTTHGTVLRRDR